MNAVNTTAMPTPQEIEEVTVKCIRRMKEHIAEEENKAKEAAEKGEIYVPGEAPFYFAIRVRTALGAPPKIIKNLKALRLHKVHTGTFVVNNKSSKAILHNLKSYIAYGTLTLETIRKIVYERGFCKYNGQRKNITAETLHNRFGAEVRSVEEIVEALYLGRSNATAINKWMWPYRLCAPRKGYGGRKIKDFAEGGMTGDHGRYLDELIKRML